MLWTESAFSARLTWRWPDHHWQCNWRVAWTYSRMWAKGGHFEQLFWQYSAIWQEAFLLLSNVTRFLDCFFFKLPQFHTSNFRKVVQQHFLLTFTYLHTEGVVGSIIWVLLEIYLAFQQWKNFYRATRMHSADYAVARCLSVRLSITRWYCV